MRAKHKPCKPTQVALDVAAGQRAEFDFGEASLKRNGPLVSVPLLAGRLGFSGAMFVECFPTQRQEAFLLGQGHAFELGQGVPGLAVDDHLQPALLQVLEGHNRGEHDVWRHFQRVYRFEALLAKSHAGWEKASVENLLGSARGNSLVPVPQGADLEAINAELRANCLADQQPILAGGSEPMAWQLVFERPHLGPVPRHAAHRGAGAQGLVPSAGRVRFQTNDYSAPIQ